MEHATPGPGRYLPHAVIATAVVTLAPAALVWTLALTGAAAGFVPLLVIGLFASLLLAYGGHVLWQLRPGSRDVLFSDLMLWGWLRRWHLERRLGNAVALLGFDADGARERSDDLDPETRLKVLKRLAAALEARDPYTHGHSRRVARYSTMIAKKLGVPSAEVARIRLAATVHDVGKLVVPLKILNKPSRLTDEEFELIKRHAPVGADMVRQMDDEELTQIVAHHHERIDGSGYPSHLAGSAIPLGARIIAVADTFDALTSTRAYRPAKRHRDVLRILRDEAGTQLDADAVQAFSRCYSGFGGIAAWSIVSGLPQRVLFPFGGQAPGAGGALAAKGATVLAATAVAGSIATSSSLTDPRDTSASPTGVPAFAAFGTGAAGAAAAQRDDGSAEPSAHRDHQGVGASSSGQGGGAEGGGGDVAEPLPGPVAPPDPVAPVNPGNPVGDTTRLVDQQLGQVRDQAEQATELSEQVAEQLEEKLPGGLG